MNKFDFLNDQSSSILFRNRFQSFQNNFACHFLFCDHSMNRIILKILGLFHQFSQRLHEHFFLEFHRQLCRLLRCHVFLFLLLFCFTSLFFVLFCFFNQVCVCVCVCLFENQISFHRDDSDSDFSDVADGAGCGGSDFIVIGRPPF